MSTPYLYLACLRVWGWPSGLDHNSRIRVSSILVLVLQVTRICRRRIFFLQVTSRKKGKNKVPTSYLQDSPSSFFCPTSHSSQESKGFLFRRATYNGTYVEAVESARAGLSPKEGDVRNKKRKRPRKARRWLPRRQGSVCPQPRMSYFGSRVIGFGSGPSCLKYRLLRDLFYEEAMCEGSSGNGLPYAVKAVPWKDYFTQVEDPAAKHCSEEGCTIALERSVSKKAVKDKRQSTFFHEFGILGDSYLGFTA